jgi:hypothetical protein
MVQTAPGYPTLDPFVDVSAANPQGWNGSQLVYGPSQDKSLLPEGSWVAFDYVIPLQDPDAGTLTHFGMQVRTAPEGGSATWSGTFYIDDIQLQ